MGKHKNPEENIEAVTKMSLQFLAEAIGQCPAGLEQSTNRDIVFAVLGFQYGAVQSAAYISGLDEDVTSGIAEDVVGRINGMDRETVSKFLDLMPMLAKKDYPPIGIGGKTIISFYNASTDEEKLTTAGSLRKILRQIDEAIIEKSGNAHSFEKTP
ncbi:MAG: hypothetical protein C1941_06660 [Prosthecochloris sp.]|nr:hypothetical protein [Prosthecochloris sp.]